MTVSVSLSAPLATGTLAAGSLAVVIAASSQASAANNEYTGDGTQSSPRLYGNADGTPAVVQQIDFSGLGSDGYVKLNVTSTSTGASATSQQSYFAQGNKTFAADVEIINAELANGWGNTYTFSGKVHGEGDLTFVTQATPSQTYIFTGNIEEWTGAILIKGSKGNTDKATSYGVSLTGGGTINLSAVTMANFAGTEKRGTLSVGKAGSETNLANTAVDVHTVKVLQNVGKVTFGGAVSSTALVVQDGSSATFSSGLTTSTLSVGTGSSVVLGEGSSAVTGGGTVNGSVTAGSTTALTLGGTLDLRTSSTLTVAGELTLAGLTLTGTGTVNLQNLTSLDANITGLEFTSTEQPDGSAINSYTVLTIDNSVSLVGGDRISELISELDPSVWAWNNDNKTLNYLVTTPPPSWDPNWGEAGVEGGPAIISMPKSSEVISGMTYVSFAGVDSFFLGSQTGAVNVDGSTCLKVDSVPSGSNKMVFGGVLDGVFGSTLTPVDSWIVYDNPGTSPSWKLLVGGNGSNEAGKTCSFYGDSHIMMMQGEVENIIGGNFRTNSDTLFSGNSYISIYDGEVRGYVVGAGTLGNGTNTSTFAGTTNIFVYTILSNSTSAWLDPSSNNLTDANASVIGGAAQGNGGGKIDFRGNTNITVDLVGVTPADSNDVFNKKLVGGSYSAGGTITITHTGSTNITVNAEEEHSFIKDIIGGSVVGSNATATHGGDINVTLNGGSYSGSVYLGGYMSGSNRTITNSGLSTLTVTDGRFTGAVVGGIYEGSGTSTVVSKGITMDLKGGEYTRTVVGGHVITGTGTSAISQCSTGDITIKLGSASSIQGTVIGGSISQRTDGGATPFQQGNITIEIADGATVNGSIYAAGGALNIDGTSSASTSKIITESTRVAIASGATLSTGTISGGYKAGTAAEGVGLASVSTVTGSKVLALTSEGSNLQDVLKNAVLESFDTIEITSANGTATLTSGMIDAGITTKTGAGTLALDGTSASTLSVAEGTLSVGGSLSTISNSLTMAEGTVLAFTQSDALTLGTLDCTRGTVTIDLSGLGYLSLGTHLTLATVNELTGWDNLVVQGLDPDFEDGLAWQNTLLTITITAKPGVYVWDAAIAGNVWQNGHAFSADGSAYSNTDATKVRFDGIDGENASETVTMRGNLVVNGRLAINPGATNTYIFSADPDQGGTLTKVQEIDIQSGTAEFGAGTLALSGDSMTAIGVAGGAELVLADAGGGQFDLTLGSEEAGATFRWQGVNPEKSTINGVVKALGSSTILLEGGSLALAGSGNTLSSVTLSNDATLDLQGDTTLTGTLSSAAGNPVTVGGTSETTLTLGGSARLQNISLSGRDGAILNVTGSNVTIAGDAQIAGMLLSVQKGGKITFEASNDRTLGGESTWSGISSAGDIAGVENLRVVMNGGATYTCGGSLADLQGTITVSGNGTQVIDATVAAAAEPATLSFAVENRATLVLSPKVTNIIDLSVGNGGKANIIVSKGDGSNATTSIETLSVDSGGMLTLSADLTQTMVVDRTAGEGAVQVSETINYGSGSKVMLDVTGIGTGLDLTGGNVVTLIVMEGDSVLGKAELSTNGTSDKLLSKYFGNTAQFKQDGNALVVTGTTVTSQTANFYKSAASSGNGRVGAIMLDGLYSTLNPQAKDPDSDAAAILSEIDQMILSDNNAAADQKMAAVSGASVTALGSAFAADMQRQLTAIRNRTTTMGVGDAYETPDMPYFNAWVNAEANFREMNDDGTMPGYELNSWGATVGVDADVTPYLTCGLALTAMYGDFTAKTPDSADGDLDIYYVTAFARYAPSAWVHTFVASVGMADASMDRTVFSSDGSYRTSGDTNGVSFGLMYEVGYTIPMNEDATVALQPVANIIYAHSSLDGYNESGSDMAVRYGDQTLDTFTIGVGLRAQAVVGENVYNRSSLLEGRVLAKFDIGDRSSSTDAHLASLPAFGGSVESAETGAFGVEIGAGVTIPISKDSGSIFLDAALELRSDYSNINGTVGYRINF